MADLPDYRSWVEAIYLLAASLAHGADAAKSADPDDGDVYLATDTSKIYFCFTDGVWTDLHALYLLLTGGTMGGAIAMGANKITGLADPAAAQDAATMAYVIAYAAALVHAARHQSGGADEISVAGLSGLLADDQHVLDAEVLAVAAALVHAARHQSGGADEINLAGLDGEPSTLTTHKDLTTGIHGAGTDHLALFPAASQVVSKVVWKDASERALTDLNRTTSSGVTDLDLTDYTSAAAKIAILQIQMRVDSYTSGYVQLRVKKNGTSPDHAPRIRGHTEASMVNFKSKIVLVGMDAGQVIEYDITISGTAQIDNYINVLGYIE